jgi:hypothetical protein
VVGGNGIGDTTVHTVVLEDRNNELDEHDSTYCCASRMGTMSRQYKVQTVEQSMLCNNFLIWLFVIVGCFHHQSSKSLIFMELSNYYYRRFDSLYCQASHSHSH